MVKVIPTGLQSEMLVGMRIHEKEQDIVVIST